MTDTSSARNGEIHDRVVRPRLWLVLGTLWFFGFSVTAFQIIPAGILPIAMADLAIGAFAASFLVSFSLAAQALTNLPIGVIIDRTSNQLILALAGVGMLIGGLWAWFGAGMGYYWHLIGGILVGGAAIAAVITGGANLIGGAFPQPVRATAVAIFITSPPTGYAAGQFSGPLIAGRFGWEYNFLIFGLMSVIAFGLFRLSCHGLHVDQFEASIPSTTEFEELIRNPDVWVVCFLGFAAYSVYLFFNSWMPTYLNNVLGIDLAQTGVFVALFPAIGVLARASGGLISDRVFEQKRRPVTVITFAITAPIVVLFILIDIPLLLVALLLPAGFFIQLSIGLFYTYVQEVVNDRVTGTALALLGFIALGGATTAPVIAGALIDFTGAFLTAFMYCLILAIGGIILAINAPEPHP